MIHRTNKLGEELRRERRKCGRTIPEMAATTGVSKNTMGSYERGDILPEIDFLARFASVTDGNFMQLLKLRLASSKVEHAREAARLLEQYAAGREDTTGGAGSSEPEYVPIPRWQKGGRTGPSAHLALDGRWIRAKLGLPPERLNLYQIATDAMEPTLSLGDIALVDMGQDSIEDDAIYLLDVHGRALLKRVQALLDGRILFKSDNPAYDPEFFTPDHLNEHFKVLGRVVWRARGM